MVGQTQVNGRLGAAIHEKQAPSANAVDLARHAVELSELQMRLFVTDLRSGARSLRIAIFAALVAAVVLIAAIPVLLLAAAGFLDAYTQLSRPASLLITGGAAVGIGAIFMAIGWHSARTTGSSVKCSIEELRNNLAWAKEVLTNTHEVGSESVQQNADD